MNLNYLLKPNKIAIIGASEKAGLNFDTCVNLLKAGKPDNIYFVNPKRDELLGKRCYKSLKDIPEQIDLVFMCVSKKIVPYVLDEMYECNCKAAVVYASGYSEECTAEGIQIEKELIAKCKEYDIAAIGPNCAGFANFIDNIYGFAFELDRIDRKGSIGFISQSGQVCLSLMDIEHMKFSYIVSSGNSSIVNMEDYLEFLIEDEATKVIALYIEGIKKPNKFIECLKNAAIKKKPIVVLKAGRSAKAQEIATAHTGSLAGSDETFNAIFEKFGVVRVDDMEELLQTSMLFSELKELPKGTNFASMNLSGGETTICADVASQYGINFPELEKETLVRLKEILPSYATPNNPLDSTATLSYVPELYAKAINIINDDPNIDMILLGFTVLNNILESSAIFPMLEGIKIARAQAKLKPIAMVSFVECTRDLTIREELAKLDIPVLPSTVCAFKIIKYLTNFINYNYSEKTLEVALPEEKRSNEKIILSEQESKKLLKEYGINVSNEIVAKSEEELINASKETGYPIVLKIESADIPHKSDIGGVKLNIQREDELVKTYHGILASAKKHKPNAQIDGISVKKMLPQGMEVIIGVNNDAQFGPMILCGLGGVFVEVFKDAKLYPAPLNKNEAHDMLKSLKSYKMFKGYRGEKPRDLDALTDTIVKVSKLAADHKNSIKEMDINPLFVYQDGSGVCAIDALVVK